MVPTYPTDPTGFMVCPKAAGRERPGGCGYYDETVYRAAFMVPEFGRAIWRKGGTRCLCSGGRRWRWRWGVDSLPGSTRFVARPCAGYVVRDPINEPIIGAHSFLHKLNTTLISRSLSSTLRPVHFPRALQAPPHLTIIPPAIAGHTHVVTTSYANTAMRTQVRWRWRCYGWEYFIPLSSDYLLHHERWDQAVPIILPGEHRGAAQLRNQLHLIIHHHPIAFQ